MFRNFMLTQAMWQVKIEDLKKQIDLMSDQIGLKDDPVSQLSEVTQKQAVHIQSLVQKNSILNGSVLIFL